jgi:hypothetical protein
VPVVLFRNGEVLSDVEGLAHREGLDAHRRAKPQSWTRWRRSNGQLQLQDSKGAWRNLHYNAVYSQLPANFRLEGRYQSLSGGGTLAVGGTDSVVAWSNYVFAKDGSVVRDSDAGARAEASDASTVSSSAAAGRPGRYRIDGIRLLIEYADGSSESRIIVTDPSDKSAAIWLDGVGYTRRK